MEIREQAQTYLTELQQVLDTFDLDALERIVRHLLDAYDHQQRIFVMGNGGSGATASHFACDINKGCCLDLKKKFKMICLNDSLPTILAYANDIAYDAVFEEQLKNFFEPGDLVIGISGSGNSENVLRAIDHARRNGGVTVGLSGFSGGKLAGMVETALVANIHDMQKVEDLHFIAVHMIMQIVHRRLHPHGDAKPAC